MSLSDTTPAPKMAGTSYLAAVHRTDRTRSRQRCGTSIVAEQPVNLPTAIYLGVFSRAEQRVLQAIFKAIADGGGRCVATLAMFARDSNTSESITRNAIPQAAAIGLLEKIERSTANRVAAQMSPKTRRDAFSSPLDQLLTWRQREGTLVAKHQNTTGFAGGLRSQQQELTACVGFGESACIQEDQS